MTSGAMEIVAKRSETAPATARAIFLEKLRTISALENASRSSESNIVATSEASDIFPKRSKTLTATSRMIFGAVSKMIRFFVNIRNCFPLQL